MASGMPTSTVTNRGLEKRKACDLCHLKRIRCNGDRPKCGNCSMYERTCTFTPFIKSKRSELKQTKRRTTTRKPPAKAPQAAEPTIIDASPLHEVTTTLGVGAEQPGRNSRLPPAHLMLPVIEDFFTNYNTIIPLFSKPKFMEMLQSYTHCVHPHDTSVEACISVVLALSIQQRATKTKLPEPFSLPTLISTAQSESVKLATRTKDLRGLRVFLGLTILYRATMDPQTALAMIATGVQLAHRLRTHEKLDSWQSDHGLTQERNHLFWVMYVLDKDVNTAFGVPYLHQDRETLLACPEYPSDMDKPGTIRERGQELIFNVFEARFHLARIQGRIYDWTRSGEHRGMAFEEKRPHVDRLRGILLGWLDAVPVEFRAERLPLDIPESSHRQLVMLHFTYFSCVFAVHEVGEVEGEWARRLRAFGQVTGYDDQTMLQEGGESQGYYWSELAQMARACMQLFRVVDQTDTALTQCISCAYFRAAVILITNKLSPGPESSNMEQMRADDALIDSALVFFAYFANNCADPHAAVLFTTCAELNRCATVSAARSWGNVVSAEAVNDTRQAVGRLIKSFTEAEMKPILQPRG